VSDGDRDAAPHERVSARLEADAELVALLAEHGFSGPRYEEFERSLYAYGKSVLMAWMRTGEIFTQCRRWGILLNPLPRPFRSDDRMDLANRTLAAALPAFRLRALVGGEWRPEGGASITTYFANGLPVQFSNPYKSWRRQARADIERQSRTAPESALLSLALTAETRDPQSMYIISETVREELGRLDSATRTILQMMADGYKYAEIAEVLGMTARAVEARVSRHRDRVRGRQGDGLG
jgi:DNA-directed RNA polymerase specialized sigma24 family protein